ncbi:MAG: hypothetical protein V4577_09910 [Bacteroidota bacterium]
MQKLSLKGIKNVLSRAELREIMAGSGPGGGGGGLPDGCGSGCYPGGCFGVFCKTCVPDGLGSHGTCQEV